ncbi:YaaR family protein [bacterium]|nr:YaaR family protein [bacterium]
MIDRISKSKNDALKTTSNRKQTQSPTGKTFGSVFVKSKLESMVDDILNVGQRLRRHPTIEILKQYKDQIKDFMKEVLENADNVKSFSGSRNSDGKEQVYKLMGKFDEELVDLTQLILDEQKDSLKILNKIDAIRGMLVDVYQ